MGRWGLTLKQRLAIATVFRKLAQLEWACRIREIGILGVLVFRRTNGPVQRPQAPCSQELGSSKSSKDIEDWSEVSGHNNLESF